jgi:phenylacetate-CoA ligase
LIQAEYEAAWSAPERLARLKDRMSESLRTRLGVRPVLELAAQGQLPRTEFKARRVIDNRELYKETLSREPR